MGSFLIIACGIFLIFIGYKGSKERKLQLLPINRRKTLTGDKAKKSGSQMMIIGFVLVLIGIFTTLFFR